MSSEYTPEMKLQLEIEKLKAETANLHKSWFRNPASWVSVVTIILALFGLGFQYRSHKAEVAEAQVKLERTQAQLRESQEALERTTRGIEENTPKYNLLLSEIDKATAALDQLKTDREKLQSELETLNAQVKDLESKANQLADTAENRQIKEGVRRASSSIGNLQITNREVIRKADGVSGNLKNLRMKSTVAPR
jgi:chromosome segregation ATPase